MVYVNILCPKYLFQISLILSRDIEINPGPVINKTCPSCDAQVPIRKKTCVCGHMFIVMHRLITERQVTLRINE